MTYKQKLSVLNDAIIDERNNINAITVVKNNSINGYSNVDASSHVKHLEHYSNLREKLINEVLNIPTTESREASD